MWEIFLMGFRWCGCQMVLQHIEKLCYRLEESGLDAVFISHPANVSYLSGTKISDSYLFVSPQENLFLTDFRYLEEAKLKLHKDFSIVRIQNSIFKLVKKIVKRLKIKRLGFEAKHLSFAEYEQIAQNIGKDTDFIPTYDLVEELRQIKDKDEIERMRKAIDISIGAFSFLRRKLRIGIKERELAIELERYIKLQGENSSLSFEMIIASGSNSSHPHARPTKRIIKKGETLLVDLGVEWQGYKSDLTRVFFLGRINSKIRGIYRIVREAQEEAFKKIKPGLRISELDLTARRYIDKKGWGRFFGHNLGHGIGLEVHESPAISSQSDVRLAQGMVFTIEPAIYLPQQFGIRLEDMVLVTEKGCEVLSGALHKSA